MLVACGGSGDGDDGSLEPAVYQPALDSVAVTGGRAWCRCTVAALLGAGSQPDDDGTGLASEGAVTVTLPYRIGRSASWRTRS